MIILKVLSVIIPARNESENLPNCINEIREKLRQETIKYEIIVIDDGSTDNTRNNETFLTKDKSILCFTNTKENGFGRQSHRLRKVCGDAVAIMMADSSDSPNDLVTYWHISTRKWLCV